MARTTIEGNVARNTGGSSDARNLMSERGVSPFRQSVAQTILQQLGGNQFVAMTGAKNLVATDNGLRLDFGKNASQANQLKITLRGDDTYDMEFWRKERNFNPYSILMRYADKGLSEAEFNAKVKAATEKAMKNAEAKMLKRYSGIYFDQLQPLFREFTKMNTRLF